MIDEVNVLWGIVIVVIVYVKVWYGCIVYGNGLFRSGGFIGVGDC